VKKSFLLSALAVVLAVGGAAASARFADTFYPAGDSNCNETQISRPCDPGDEELCKDENQVQYYYKINGTGNCLPLTKPD
jgi:hypothetical protein